MKRFRDIIQDIKAPSTSDLWINNGELKYYNALYPIQGIAPNSSPDLVPSRLCYCHYSSYSAMALLMEGALLQLRSNPQVSTL